MQPDNRRTQRDTDDPQGRRPGPARPGPRGYVRSDERILEDVCEALIADQRLDSSAIRVTVDAGVVVLEGHVEDRRHKVGIERVIAGVRGVRDIDNRVRVADDDLSEDLDPGLRGGIFHALLESHRELLDDLDALTAGRRDTAEQRAARLAAIASHLVASARAEQEVFYPALEGSVELASEVRKSLVEHELVEHLLAELDSILPASPEWMARAEVLRELVQHHIHNEELKVFPKAQRLLDPAQADALGERLTTARDRHHRKLVELAETRAGRGRARGAPGSEPGAAGDRTEDAGK